MRSEENWSPAGTQGSDSLSGTMLMNSDFSTKQEEALKESKQVSDLNRFGFCIPGSHVGDESARGDTRSKEVC